MNSDMNEAEQIRALVQALAIIKAAHLQIAGTAFYGVFLCGAENHLEALICQALKGKPYERETWRVNEQIAQRITEAERFATSHLTM